MADFTQLFTQMDYFSPGMRERWGLGEYKNINTAPVAIVPWIIIITLSTSIVLLTINLTFCYRALISILSLPVYLFLYKKMS
jgi:hypothetical protein